MIEQERYKQVMAQFPTGVAVISVADGDGGITGLTASSFTSVSLDPPLVLFCTAYDTDSFPHLRREQRFAINVLADDQTDLAWQFAGSEPDKGHAAPHLIRATGTPVLTGAVAVIECEKHAVYPGGDHAIVVGRVVALDLDQALRPLLYWRGNLSGFQSSVTSPDGQTA
jgi:flavin reductase (DIM6/NTAB) family NADH-FMN oxidoreductase RutF